MPIARRPKSSFTPCPEGLHHAVCVDVVDLGIMKTAFGDKPKVRVIWQIEEPQPSGERFRASKMYTLSLHEKAALCKDLESWRARRFTPEELDGFDLDKVIGVNAQVQVVHTLGDEPGTVWDNVIAVVPAPKGVPRLLPLNYTRVKDRTDTPGHSAPVTEDDIPF